MISCKLKSRSHYISSQSRLSMASFRGFRGRVPNWVTSQFTDTQHWFAEDLLNRSCHIQSQIFCMSLPRASRSTKSSSESWAASFQPGRFFSYLFILSMFLYDQPKGRHKWLCRRFNQFSIWTQQSDTKRRHRHGPRIPRSTSISIGAGRYVEQWYEKTRQIQQMRSSVMSQDDTQASTHDECKN